MLMVRMLGQFSIQNGDAPVVLQSRPAQSLLALLMLTAGMTHRREQLAGTLWPNASDRNARDYLRHELWRLNRALESNPAGTGFFIVNKISIAFNAASAYWLDARQIHQTSLHAGVSIEEELDAAFLYRGELLPGFYEDWVIPHRMQALAAFDLLMPRLLARLREQQRYEDAARASMHWITYGDMPEAAYRELMFAHHNLHDLAAIRHDMEACAAHLHKQYNARPSRRTVDFFQSLVGDHQSEL